MAPFGFQLSLQWNGIDEEKWPFEKIVAALAGSSFKKPLSAKLGSCTAEFSAEGARWHTLSVTVVRP